MDLAAAFLEQNRLLADLTSRADPGTPVPTCPGWTLRELVTHVGRGDRWAAAIVERREFVDRRSVPDGKPPVEPAAASAWLLDSAQLLVDAVEVADGATPVWTFIGPRQPAWWIRRRLHESVVHRADAVLAAGESFVVDPEVAADGLSEWLMLLAARPPEEGIAPLDDGVSLHLHATDDGLGSAGEWTVRSGAAGVEWEHGHGKGTAAVRGTAAALLLTALRRLPADHVQVLGDEAVWTTWLARTGF